MKRFMTVGFCVTLLFVAMCGRDFSKTVQSFRIELTLCGPFYKGSGENCGTDYALWIETGDGRYVKTLKITREAVNVGENSSFGHLPVWAEKAGYTYKKLESDLLPDTMGIPLSLDAITQASPYFFQNDTIPQFFTAEWDLTEENGAPAASRKYRFCAEAANITRAEDESVTINPESTAGVIDLSRSIMTPAAPTAHIKSLRAYYIGMTN
jgi:hypothetical protein